MKTFKLFIFLIAASCGFFITKNSWATCSNFTSYTDGQVLTAASLNSLQTNYTNCVNNVLDGDNLTGSLNFYSGADLNIYSDTGTTLRATIDGATGESIISPRTIGTSINCEVNYSAGTITISGRDGAALSATNPCYVGIRSNSNGVVSTARFTSNITVTDGAASQTDGNLFGITNVNWASAMPMFFGVIYDGTTPYFTLSRTPEIVSGAANTNLCQLNDTDCDTEADVMILTTGLTLANWVNLPITQVAWLTATYATASSVWTFAETAYTGFNQGYEAIDFTFPLAQMGAATGTFFQTNAGTAPIFTTNTYLYRVFKNREFEVYIDLRSDAGTDGAGAVTTKISIPYVANTTNAFICGMAHMTAPGGAAAEQTVEIFPASADSYVTLQETAAGTVQNGDFSNGNRLIEGMCRMRM